MISDCYCLSLLSFLKIKKFDDIVPGGRERKDDECDQKGRASKPSSSILFGP